VAKEYRREIDGKAGARKTGRSSCSPASGGERVAGGNKSIANETGKGGGWVRTPKKKEQGERRGRKK